MDRGVEYVAYLTQSELGRHGTASDQYESAETMHGQRAYGALLPYAKDGIGSSA